MLEALRRFAIPIGIAFAFLISVLVVQSSDAFQSCIEDAQYQAAQTSHEKQIADVPVTFVMRERCWGKFVHLYSDGIVALFTIILAGSTIALWLTTRATLELTEKTAKRQLRAYVMIESANLKIEPDQYWAIIMEVKNFGQTPAYGVSITTDYALTAPIGTNEILPIANTAVKHARTIMGPGKVHVIRLPCSVTRCLLTSGEFGFSKMSEAGNKVYVWGRIDYMTFDEHRWLTFQLVCHMGQVTAFSFCETGNDADDQHRQEYEAS